MSLKGWQRQDLTNGRSIGIPYRRIEIMTRIEDDMDEIHALHLAHGDKVHCNYCDCQCKLCKAEGFKYRETPCTPEVLRFKVGEVLRAIKSEDGGFDVGDEVIYIVHRRF
jgi:hypothetical protein